MTRADRLRRSCRRRLENKTDDRQVALVLRMIERPDVPIIELRAGQRARLHVRGSFASPVVYSDVTGSADPPQSLGLR